MSNYDKNVDINELTIKPIEISETIPSDWYSEEYFYKIDLKAIFGQTWQYVGSIEKLSKQGDFIIAEVAENPIIILRDDNNKLRAFFNVCRHRAGPIATIDGNTKVLKCKYHGWSYNLKGKLLGTPEFEGVECFDKENYSLKEINVEVWENLLFVNLSEKSVPIEQVFSGIKERIIPIDLTKKKFYSRVYYEINCNWKIYVDNYLEGYHLPHVHPELNDLLDYKNYVTETSDFYSLQYSPFSDNENHYSNENGEAFYYFISPNFMLNILPGRLQTNLVIPIAKDKTRVIFDYYYDDIESEKAKDFIKKDIEYSDIVQVQDIEICQLVQKGVNSNCYTKGRLSVKREKGLYHFHNTIRNCYKEFLK